MKLFIWLLLIKEYTTLVLIRHLIIYLENMRKLNKFLISKYDMREIWNIINTYLHNNFSGLYTRTTLKNKWEAEEFHLKVSSWIIIDEWLFNKSWENWYNIIFSEISQAFNEYFVTYITDQEVDVYFKVNEYTLQKDNPFYGGQDLNIKEFIDLLFLIEYWEDKASQLGIKKENFLNKIFKWFYKIK